MPIQLRIIAIVLGLFFLAYMIILVRAGKAKVSQIRKWLVLGVLMLIGAIFVNFFMASIGLLGFKVFANFVFASILFILIFFVFDLQLALIKAENQITTLTQEVSLLKAEKRESEDATNQTPKN